MKTYMMEAKTYDEAVDIAVTDDDIADWMAENPGVLDRKTARELFDRFVERRPGVLKTSAANAIISWADAGFYSEKQLAWAAKFATK